MDFNTDICLVAKTYDFRQCRRFQNYQPSLQIKSEDKRVDFFQFLTSSRFGKIKNGGENEFTNFTNHMIRIIRNDDTIIHET